jgi:S1-C subfamily serine protease
VAPNLNVVLANGKPSDRFLADALTTKVVTVRIGLGHGSGFFITPQGHILTNAHVVGDARRVRIELSGRKQATYAEVLRLNKPRDVALLRLEKLPENFVIDPLPLRMDWPRVSEDIYLLGAPEDARMQDTLSKGIVSAHRKNFHVFGHKMDFIQGDITVRGGNSGGPLMDAHGNIIGICVAGLYAEIGEGDSGLNLFIPIQGALEALDIQGY